MLPGVVEVDLGRAVGEGADLVHLVGFLIDAVHRKLGAGQRAGGPRIARHPDDHDADRLALVDVPFLPQDLRAADVLIGLVEPRAHKGGALGGPISAVFHGLNRNLKFRLASEARGLGHAVENLHGSVVGERVVARRWWRRLKTREL